MSETGPSSDRGIRRRPLVPVIYLSFILFKVYSYSIKGSIFRYVFDRTHIPRLEDWPAMPVEHIGFMLMVIFDLDPRLISSY